MSVAPDVKHSRNILAQALVLAALLILCLGAGALGSLVTLPAIPGWYAALDKPAWTPPNWLFGPVWTALYVMMAVSAWLVWRRAGVGPALGAFFVQLAFNAAWSPLFFGMHLIGLALIDIVLLWLALAAALALAWRVHRAAGALLVPYLVWVSYATALNFAIWRMNS